MKFFERRSTRPGPSIWRRIVTSTLRTVDGACWSAICKRWRLAKARLKNSRVPDSLILTGFPGMNDAYQSILVRVAAAVEPIMISFHLLINFGNKIEIMTAFKHQIGSNGEQGWMCN